ncbi:MAG: MaoC family dehydratase [Phenylobacterium sp.]|uniref:MaoC family dehydratase n=1 Tax=Phenylobacterium sp. TaxID=1871053 RepID=UPI002734AB3F|nr:MaoC family dehydratase [Phenylobacterium sp.]MDP3174074.1 MaoC family dehydratase [Phenylobacterium sp.]
MARSSEGLGEARVQGLFYEDLSLGQTADITRVVTLGDITAFAAVSGDVNPVHLDEAYARTTAFGGRLAHGILSAAFISAVLGVKLPGPGSIYLSQNLRFRRPVKIGDTVTARVTVTELNDHRGHATLSTVCLVDGKTALDGEAVLMVPRRKAP